MISLFLVCALLVPCPGRRDHPTVALYLGQVPNFTV